MIARRVRLELVASDGFRRLARREKLLAEAQRLFPGNQDLAAKWVEARMLLGARKPSVEIGIQRADTSRALRALPIGSVEVRRDIPAFLRRFLKP